MMQVMQAVKPGGPAKRHQRWTWGGLKATLNKLPWEGGRQVTGLTFSSFSLNLFTSSARLRRWVNINTLFSSGATVLLKFLSLHSNPHTLVSCAIDCCLLSPPARLLCASVKWSWRSKWPLKSLKLPPSYNLDVKTDGLDFVLHLLCQVGGHCVSSNKHSNSHSSSKFKLNAVSQVRRCQRWLRKILSNDYNRFKRETNIYHLTCDLLTYMKDFLVLSQPSAMKVTLIQNEVIEPFDLHVGYVC